jgi:hypothetical protein
MMPPLLPETILTDRRAYAEVRDGARDRMIRLRALRRVRLGDRLVAEFENSQTLSYQVQEMVYAEGISDPAEVAAELAAYSRLLPTSHELVATLFVELDEVGTVREELARLRGVQHVIGIEVDGRRILGQELPGPDEAGTPEETYSVHFLRFPFGEEERDAFRDPERPASLVVDHAEYAEEVALAGATRLALLADLALQPS